MRVSKVESIKVSFVLKCESIKVLSISLINFIRHASRSVSSVGQLVGPSVGRSEFQVASRLASLFFILYVSLFFTCQRWVCHIQNSRTKACCPCFQDSLLPPAYFNPSIVQHTSITQPMCQLYIKAVFNRVSAFPVLFPPEHNRETSPVPALNQFCSQLLGSFSVRTMPHTVLNAFALVGIFVKDSTTIQAMFFAFPG